MDHLTFVEETSPIWVPILFQCMVFFKDVQYRSCPPALFSVVLTQTVPESQLSSTLHLLVYCCVDFESTLPDLISLVLGLQILANPFNKIGCWRPEIISSLDDQSFLDSSLVLFFVEVSFLLHPFQNPVATPQSSLRMVYR